MRDREREREARRKSFLQKRRETGRGTKTNRLPPHSPTENEYIKCVLTLTLDAKYKKKRGKHKYAGRQNKLKERKKERGRAEHIHSLNRDGKFKGKGKNFWLSSFIIFFFCSPF